MQAIANEGDAPAFPTASLRIYTCDCFLAPTKRARRAPRVEAPPPRTERVQRERVAESRRSRVRGRLGVPAHGSALWGRVCEVGVATRTSVTRTSVWSVIGLRPTAAAQTRSQAGSKIEGSNTRCPRRGTMGIDAAPASCTPRFPRGPWRRRSHQTGSRTSWPGAARLMRHAATAWSCT